MLRQLMARVMMTTGLATLLAGAHAAQNAVAKAPPPFPRSTSHACSQPRNTNSHNGKNHFPFKSGMGPREMHRRRVGNLGTFRKEAEAWLQ